MYAISPPSCTTVLPHPARIDFHCWFDEGGPAVVSWVLFLSILWQDRLEDGVDRLPPSAGEVSENVHWKIWYW